MNPSYNFKLALDACFMLYKRTGSLSTQAKYPIGKDPLPGRASEHPIFTPNKSGLSITLPLCYRQGENRGSSECLPIILLWFF